MKIERKFNDFKKVNVLFKQIKDNDIEFEEIDKFLSGLNIPSESTLKDIKIKVDNIIGVRVLSGELKEIDIELNKCLDSLDKNVEVKGLKELRKRAVKLQELRNVKNKYDDIDHDLKIVDKNLSIIKIPEDLTKLSKRIKLFSDITIQDERLRTLKQDEKDSNDAIKERSEILEDEIKNYKEYLKKIKVCPFCKSSITEKVLSNIKL